ncbi:MAG TPA: HAD-IC family P-type ATPase, partial [Bacteroidota bacterium]|nr:HAD-IC family P-type ATPase [Bacteroidota bacterium]
SYFPLAAVVTRNGSENSVPITSLRPGDRIILRNNEIIPADSVIIKGAARIDYSFATGESVPVEKGSGDLAFAGGRQVGSTVELEVVKEVSESKLIQLWNDFGTSEKPKSRLLTLSSTTGKYFTIAILGIALTTTVIWSFIDPSRILDAVSSVLIVACPCAIALAAPFAFGTTMRIFGKRGFYLKNASVVESLAKVGTVVFDKTGTLTRTSLGSARFCGEPLSPNEMNLIFSLARSSTHPLSRSITEQFSGRESMTVEEFSEIEGEGVGGIVDGTRVHLGSAQFTGAAGAGDETRETRVYCSIGGVPRGWFSFGNSYRDHAGETLAKLGTRRTLMVLSGDSDHERVRLSELFGNFAEMRFNQKPAGKLAFIQTLQKDGHNVLMIGDGLNDAGALWRSDVGIAVTEDVTSFSPACDAILDGDSFQLLGTFVEFTSTSLRVVYAGLALSLLYNLVGLWFAVQGLLSPLLAALLMPVSSISVVIFSTASIRHRAKKKGIL